MGNCVFCGASAGFLRKEHAECRQKNDQGKQELAAAAAEAVKTGKDLKTLQQRLVAIAAAGYIPDADIKPALVQVWEQTATGFLKDNVLSEEEETRLITFSKQLGLTQADLDEHHMFTRVTMNATLREVLAGRVPNSQVIRGDIPFNFLKGETLVWLFTNVPYYEEKTSRSYVGSYQGASIRIMKGVYYRVGGFKGQPVETTALARIDTGLLGVTTQHVYFAGGHKSFRIPYPKIVSFAPFSDGIGITRDAANAKPQIFVTGDGWFIYNLVVNLAHR